ncbi:MAG: hypothetical protein IJH65_10950 [Methanobrevibacter sp.]|nr:hypothetical protein [Methanobrevibacter sp.]
MASKVTQEDIININELYVKHKTYAAVARETGFAPSTVKKYVIPDYIPQDKIEKKIFTEDQIPENLDYSLFKGVENWAPLCKLTETEIAEIKELWKEITI